MTATIRPLLHPASRALAANAIAVASGKGGVGKTWLAITLSQALARRGRRVLLFDGDLGLANIDIQLGLLPEHDISTVLSRGAALADTIEPFAAGGFDILAGRSGTGSLATLAPPQLDLLTDELLHVAPRYDDMVLDLGAGVDHAVRRLAGLAGRCLVVITDEPTALTDAYALIKVVRRERPAADFRVVVNMVASRADGERAYGALRKACAGFLGFAPPLAGIVRRDSRVRDAIRHQNPLLSRFPSAPAAADVTALAAALGAG